MTTAKTNMKMYRRGETCKVLEVTAAFVYKYSWTSPFAFIVNPHTDE